MSFLLMAFAFSALFPFGQVEASETSIQGLVLDTRTGAPVEGALVEVLTSGDVAVTDARGEFELRSPKPFEGAPQVRVSAAGAGLPPRIITLVPGSTQVTVLLGEGGDYAEHVTVSAEVPAEERGAPAQGILVAADFEAFQSPLADDPLRLVHALPSVATPDDYASTFSVRGSDFRHVGIALDGIPNPLIVHAVPDAEEAGSVAMVNTEVLESATLLSGSYPQRYGNRTGAQLEMRTREGSRKEFRLKGAVSATSSSFVAEGPFTRNARGSWLVAARKSYLDWLVREMDPAATAAFGFVDTQSKLVYDVSPRHQFQLGVLAGHLHFEDRDADLGPGSIREGVGHGNLVNASWRTTSDRTVLTQRLYFVERRSRSFDRDGSLLLEEEQWRLGYRVEASHALAERFLVEAGGALERAREGQSGRLFGFSEESFVPSAWAQLRWSSSAPSALAVQGGARIDRFPVMGLTTVSPWFQLERKAFGEVRLKAGAGLFQQAPGTVELRGPKGSPGLDPERAWHFDVGLEQTFANGDRGQVSLYGREERSFLWLPDAETRLRGGQYVSASRASHFQNCLDGSARGVELVYQRASKRRLSGGVSYAFSVARVTDTRTREEYPADSDQRHTLNLYGQYRISTRLHLGFKFRAGSNYPLSGYYRESDDERYFVSDSRNRVRLPAYARLDLRVSRAFDLRRSRLTFVAEVLNAANRTNWGRESHGWIRRDGEGINVVKELFPLVPSVGLLLEF